MTCEARQTSLLRPWGLAPRECRMDPLVQCLTSPRRTMPSMQRSESSMTADDKFRSMHNENISTRSTGVSDTRPL